MKFTIALIVLIACAAPAELVAAAAPASAPASTQPVSGTRYATRTFRITWHGLQPDDPMFYSEALSDSVHKLAPAVVRRALDVDGAVSVNAVSRQSSIDLLLTLNLPEDARPAAKELAAKALEDVQEQATARFQQQWAEETLPRREAADEAKERVRSAEDEAAKLRREMRDLAGRADISDKTITDALTRLEEEKQKIELDQMAKTARRGALEEQIARESAKIEKKMEADPIAAELQKVVDARQQKAEFANQQAGSGVISMGEVRDAVAQLAESRAKLLERKRDAAAEAGGDALASLNKELLTLSVDLRELEARLKFVQERLPHLRDAMDRLDAYQRAEAALLAARNDYAAASKELYAFSHQGQTLRPPTFEVLQSTDRESPPERKEQSLFGGGNR
jgi:hypothetical protein